MKTDSAPPTRPIVTSHKYRNALFVTAAAIGISVGIAYWTCHWTFDEVLGTLATVSEVFILFVVVVEIPDFARQLKDIRDNTVTTVGSSDALFIGTRVHVLKPVLGIPREEWADDNSVWRIVSVNSKTNTATAVPVAPPLNTQGQVPTVEGPMTGPNSPFIRM